MQKITYEPLTYEQLAQRIAQDIPDGAYVNLGIGIPTKIVNYLPKDKEIFLHSENGLLGMGPTPRPGQEDPDLISAGKQPVTLTKGGCYFHSGDSFAMMRGSYLDLCVLGAYQVSEQGDLANWSTGVEGSTPAVGGAMDLAVGARQVYVMTSHMTKNGECKIVKKCTYPLTGLRCVKRIYSDLAVMDVTPNGLVVIEIFGGVTEAQLQEITPAHLTFNIPQPA